MTVCVMYHQYCHFSLVLNLPRYFKKGIKSINCQEGGQIYYTQPDGGLLSYYQTTGIITAYKGVYFTFGIVLPLVILTFCNRYLIQALKESNKMQQQLYIGYKDKKRSSNKNIVTLTLTTIVILYTILVWPAEILAFWKPYVQSKFSCFAFAQQYSLAGTVCNMLQAFNFAINFVLYCAINVHFRKVIWNLVTCKPQDNALLDFRRSTARNNASTKARDYAYGATPAT